MPKKPTSSSAVYIGIDPGQSGGIAVIKLTRVVTYSMPKTERDVWLLLNRGEFRSLPVFASIEKVHAMPKQGVSSTFKFGVGYGGLRMALTAAAIPFQEVTPQAWMRALEIPKRKKTETKLQFKDRLRALAQQLYPDLEVWSSTLGEQRAVCDALLIARYCQLKHQGKLQ